MEMSNKSRKRHTNDELGRGSKNPRIEVINVENDSDMVIDSNPSNNPYYDNNTTIAHTQCYPQVTSRTSLSYITSQEDNELSSEMNRLDIDREHAFKFT